MKKEKPSCGPPNKDLKKHLSIQLVVFLALLLLAFLLSQPLDLSFLSDTPNAFYALPLAWLVFQAKQIYYSWIIVANLKIFETDVIHWKEFHGAFVRANLTNHYLRSPRYGHKLIVVPNSEIAKGIAQIYDQYARGAERTYTFSLDQANPEKLKTWKDEVAEIVSTQNVYLYQIRIKENRLEMGYKLLTNVSEERDEISSMISFEILKSAKKNGIKLLD